MSLPRFFNRAGSQTLIAGRKSREREKERESDGERGGGGSMVLAHKSFVLACFLRI